ncbi:hypothetical protein K2X40_00485 [Candidatus Babeliales bacterium]|nr:hypothetical protein [Candidatus Babeliales bacterium]
MNNVIVAWCAGNETTFERHVPLVFVGRRNRQLGYSNDISIVFLQGFELLSDAYKAELRELGFTLHNANDLYQQYAQRYAQLDRFGDYEKKCFLRWLVIRDLFNNEPVIHYDGDIVFNEDPKIIATKLAGTTFVLQGCPAFTVISDVDWFAQYQEQLDHFVVNIESYSAQAWQQRGGWEISFKTRWAGSRFRKTITSDQDLISHLIHTRQLVQQTVEDICLCLRDYLFFENPLLINFYDDCFPYQYSRKNGVDYFSYVREDAQHAVYTKRILFWHMQSCFNFYLAKYLLRKKLIVPLGRLALDLENQTREGRANKFLKRLLQHDARLSVYQYFFGQSDFSGVFSDRIWWKKGIFR